MVQQSAPPGIWDEDPDGASILLATGRARHDLLVVAEPVFLREVEALNRLNVPAVRANWRDAGKIAGILRKMPVSTLRRVARTSNPMALRLMVLFNLQSGYRDGSFDKTISIPRLIHTRTSEYRAEYRAGSAA